MQIQNGYFIISSFIKPFQRNFQSKFSFVKKSWNQFQKRIFHRHSTGFTIISGSSLLFPLQKILKYSNFKKEASLHRFPFHSISVEMFVYAIAVYIKYFIFDNHFDFKRYAYAQTYPNGKRFFLFCPENVEL